MLNSDQTETYTKLEEQPIDWFKRDKTVEEKFAEKLKIENPRKPKS